MGSQTDWVLIGGPPCQAYSLAGRSRLRSKDVKKFEADAKHFLYIEYLRIIQQFAPAVFVMENVKGMLNSTNSGKRIFEQILADLKAHPGQRSFGSPGNGSSPHLAAEMMKSQTNVFAVHVPYRGAAPALTDLLGGQIDFLFDPGIAIPHIKAGKLRLLAVGSPQRSPLFPDVPTLDELGLKGFDADTVFGFYAPARTPANVIDNANAAINAALQDKAVIASLGTFGMSPRGSSVREMDRSQRQEYFRWGPDRKSVV